MRFIYKHKESDKYLSLTIYNDLINLKLVNLSELSYKDIYYHKLTFMSTNEKFEAKNYDIEIRKQKLEKIKNESTLYK